MSRTYSAFRFVAALTAVDVVVNAAVLVNVDECEANPELAYAVNALGPLFIADALRTLDLKNTAFVQFSSSDIFGSEFGANPKEDDEAFLLARSSLPHDDVSQFGVVRNAKGSLLCVEILKEGIRVGHGGFKRP